MRNSSPLRNGREADSPSKSVHWADSAKKSFMTRGELSPNKSSLRKTEKPSERKQNSEDFVRKLEYAPF